MFQWDTVDGGPCFFRPTGTVQPENPIYKTDESNWPLNICANGDGDLDENGFPVNGIPWFCNTTYDKNAIQISGKPNPIFPWDGAGGWNNQFALTYELGLYYN